MNTKQYILAIDQSTSSTKAMLIDEALNIYARVNRDHKQYYPQTGWVEHDPEEIYHNLLNAVTELIKQEKINWQNISGISISNQRETVVVWDKNTGKPVCNAIVWQCSRATELCAELSTEKNCRKVREATGLMLSPYFSAAKISWILQNIPQAREKSESGDLLAGTIDSWLVWKLTKGKLHATDLSNASRTSLLNLQTLDWDKNICNIFEIPLSMLPKIKRSDTIWAKTDFEGNSTEEINIAGILGDSHAALFAQQCFVPGTAKATYGTGSSVMMNVGKQRSNDIQGLVSSIGWGRKDEVIYVLEGNINSTGATIKWLADNLNLISSVQEAEKEAKKTANNNGVYLVPAFSGLAAPYWDNEARAIISGMSFNTSRAHIIRAGLESIAYQITDIIELMTEGSGYNLSILRTDGGPTRNSFLMQFQADILRTTVIPAHIEELSAVGSAMMAGLATGIWKDLKSFKPLLKAGKTFSPKLPPVTRDSYYQGWKKAVERARK